MVRKDILSYLSRWACVILTILFPISLRPGPMAKLLLAIGHKGTCRDIASFSGLMEQPTMVTLSEEKRLAEGTCEIHVYMSSAAQQTKQKWLTIYC